MSASNELQYHREIRRHFHPCPGVTDESDEDSSLSESEGLSSNTIVSNTTVWNNIEIFDSDIFPSANLPSILDDGDIKSLRSLFMIPDSFSIFKPKDVDRVYDLISFKGCLGVGISVSAFECGFRVPMHPFLEKVLDTCDVGLGQLSPNSFLNINTFIARCFARKTEPNIDIFWSHYQLTSTSKCVGFYSIGRKNTSQKWSDARSNDKGFYENWFFLVGPKVDNYAQWSYYISKEIPKKKPDLDTPTSELYRKLKSPHDKSMILSTEKIRSEAFLIEIKVSCIGMSESVVQQRLREQKLARLEKKKNSNKSKAQKPDVVEQPPDEEMNHTCYEIELAADASIEPDPVSPPTKKQKNNAPKAPPKASKYILESASSSSIALGRDMSSAVTLHATDEKKLSTMNSVLRGEEVMAFASQILLWSREQVEASKIEFDQLTKLEKAATVARDKANSDQQKLVVAEASLKKFEADTAARENQFKETISSLEKQLQEAKQAQIDAEANWYGVGLDKRLQMVKDAKMDFTKCMFDYELEEWQMEEAEARSGVQNGDIGTVVPNVGQGIPLQEDTEET